MEDGEKYIVYYDKDDPEQSSLGATEPIYDTTDFVNTVSLPLNVSVDKGSHEITFKFIVKQDTITRTNRVLFNNKYEQKERVYPVYYRADRPIISYLEMKND